MTQTIWDDGIQSREEAHRQEQHRQKRMSILRVAARAFNTQGYYKTTLASLAKELNVTKPTLYYYVKNKDDILDGILAIAIEQFRELIKSSAELNANGLEKLRSFVLKYGELVTDDFGICLIMMRINAPEDKFREPYHALSREVYVGLQAIVQSGLGDGSIAHVEPKYIASALMATLNEAAYWYLVEGRESPKDAAGKFLQVFETGLQS